MILLDRQPPAPTGDARRDTQALYEWAMYLYEQMNFILTNLQKGETNAKS